MTVVRERLGSAADTVRRRVAVGSDRFAHPRRFDLRAEIAHHDPVAGAQEITQLLGTREFPWSVTQSLSFALFRTYAVPSIGNLLDRTGEFTERTQKRYDDTVLLIDAAVEHGFASPEGRAGIRRINQMHGMYDISNDDLRYVLATFVVCPVRWINRYEWRTLSDDEIDALTSYYQTLGKYMAIKGIPETYADFERLMVDYEREHFAFDPGARRVADATLDLMGTFAPYRWLPRRVVRRISYALMDSPLLAAFRYPEPTRAERAVVYAGMRARALVLRFARPRTEPFFARHSPSIRSYPNGYDVADLGTFTPGCPVPHTKHRHAAGGAGEGVGTVDDGVSAEPSAPPRSRPTDCAI